MKLLSSIKLVTIATIALTLFVLPNFAQDTPQSTPTEPTPTQSTPTEPTPTESTPTESTPTAEPSSSTFPDISDNPYQAEIQEAAELGIIKGFPDGTFKPDETVTREQAAVMIVQAINSKVPIDLNEKPPQRSVQPFLDVPEDRWSAKAIYWLQWNLYPANTAQLTGNFRPEDPITRVGLVDFLRRTAELVKVKISGSPELSEPDEPIVFSDVSGYDKVLTMQMSAHCRVAAPVDEGGDTFAPEESAHRDYTAAAIVRTLNCGDNETN